MATMNSGMGGPAGYGENAFSSTRKFSGDNDDGNVKIDITSVFSGGMNFFGTTYSEIYLGVNGIITFGGSHDNDNDDGFPVIDLPALVPFYSDLDVDQGGEVYWDFDTANGKITITWDAVEPYNYRNDDYEDDDDGAANSFQVVLTDLGGGDFHVEYIYEDIQDAYVGGDNAIAGFTDGAGTVFELEGSGNDSFMESNYSTNDFDYGDPAGTFSFSTVNGTPDALSGPPCYAPGTLIDTPDGQRPVEALAVGDMVNTLDHGPQPIRWVRSGSHPLEQVEPDAKPVLIAAGALGRGLPMQDLIVSPQHRVVVGGGGQLDGWFKAEAFAPAKSLTSLPGIRHMKGKTSITWIHFACDRHEVVSANGCLSESLLLGPMVTNGLARIERKLLADIFGPAVSDGAALNGPAARKCLKVGEVRRHLTKCKKVKEQRTAKDIRKWDLDLMMERWESDEVREALPRGEERHLKHVS
ncbi:Hint domain-containing protein [Roseovarius sp. S1116L3]|uniref:Hint domain-containing protein n=1 Tax=Roseovarius roseus TaxID=3342636 RepID=UPI00372C1693